MNLPQRESATSIAGAALLRLNPWGWKKCKAREGAEPTLKTAVFGGSTTHGTGLWLKSERQLKRTLWRSWRIACVFTTAPDDSLEHEIGLFYFEAGCVEDGEHLLLKGVFREAVETLQRPNNLSDDHHAGHKGKLACRGAIQETLDRVGLLRDVVGQVAQEQIRVGEGVLRLHRGRSLRRVRGEPGCEWRRSPERFAFA